MSVLLALDAFLSLPWMLAALHLPRTLRPLTLDRRGDVEDRPGAPSARVSVIIPARDEERLLPRCLDSVRSQDFPVHEVLVVDDESSDRTGTVAAARGATVVRAGARPPGWVGKTWASHVGAGRASGDWLLFLDADATLAPGCLAAALREAAERDADLLTILPRPVCSSVFEAVVQPVFLLATLAFVDPRAVNDPQARAAAAWGGFLLFRRAAYESLGGHATVHAEVVEDLLLARAVKERGLRLRVVAGPDLVESARPQAPGRLWDAGCRLVLGSFPPDVIAPLLVAAAVLALFCGPWLLAPLGPAFALLLAAQVAGVLAVRAQLARSLGLDARAALLQPLGALFLAGVLLRAALSGSGPRRWIRWRARRYSA